MSLDREKRPCGKLLSYLNGYNGIFLIIYVFCILFIHNFVTWEGGPWRALALRGVVILAALLLVCPFVMGKIRRVKVPVKGESMTGKKKVLWLTAFFLLSFGVLLRWYLSYYPGAFSTDAVYQYKQALSGRYNDWKPILQTLITFTLPIKLTGRADAIVLFQIIEYSCVLAYMAYVILKYSNKWFAIVSLAYILINPITGNLVVCPWKDVTFAIFAVWLMTFGLQIHMTDGKWLDSKRNIFFLSIVLIVTTIVRHNGFLFTLPFLAAVLIRMERRKRIYILLLFAAGYGLIRGPLYAGLEVEEQWDHKTRVLGVPMAILGNVAKESPDLLDETTRKFVYEVAPKEMWENVYDGGSFNLIKWQADQTVIEETGAVRVLQMAAGTLLRAPGPALKGFFELTDMVYTISNNLDWYIAAQVDENDIGTEYRQFCDRFVLENYTELSRNSILKYIFWYIGVINLLIIASALSKYSFRVKEDRKRLLFALPVLCYNFGTMLLLSGNTFRYFYFCFPVCPIVLLILFGEKEQARKESAGDGKEAVIEASTEANAEADTEEAFGEEVIGATIGDFTESFRDDSVEDYTEGFTQDYEGNFAEGFVEDSREELQKDAKTDSGTDTEEGTQEDTGEETREETDKDTAEDNRHSKKQKKVRENAGRILRKLAALAGTVRSGIHGISVVYAVLLALVIVLGSKINMAQEPYFGQMTFTDLCSIALWFALIMAAGKGLLIAADKWSFGVRSLDIRKGWWFGGFLILVLLWSPYLLAYYPGILTPDSLTSLLQAKDLSLLYNHIPVAYTLAVALFARIGWWIGDANFGVFVFSLAQLFTMAGVLSYSAYWIRRKLHKPVVSWAALLFYGLNPVVAMHSITMWKDVLFSAWIVLLCLFLFDVALSGGRELKDRKGIRRLCVLLTIISFGRNNGLYVAVICLAVLLIAYKDIRKKLLVKGGEVLLAILLIQGPGYAAFGITQSGFAESVGIPLQQVSYTVIHDGELTEEDREFLENIIPIQAVRESYSPVSADNIKFNPEFNTAFFEENKAGFVKLYLKLLPGNLQSYVKSYLLSTSGFWRIKRTDWLVGEEVYENDMGIYNIDYLKEYFHLNWKENMPTVITQLKHSPVTNVGVMVWLVFFFAAAALAQKQRWKEFLILPVLGCWLTLMIATPVAAQFRYVYYYHLMLPVVCIMLFAKKEKL